MPKVTPVIAAAVAVIAAFNATPARAQANRTFVSGFGSDSSNCSFQNPCRTFAAALLVTNAKGEIAVLDPADYGTVTIGKSVSIVNDGVGVASITSTGTAAITINAGASDVVNLRGLTLNGAGAVGILFEIGGALNIQNCVIRGFPGDGIAFTPSQSGTLTVLDTIVSNNGTTNSPTGAIEIIATSGTVNVYLGRVQVSGNLGSGIRANAGGLQSGGSFTMTVADSVATGSVGAAGVTLAAGTAPTTATLINTRLTNNNVGLGLFGGTAYLAETVISGNTSNGFAISSGVIKSFGNNRITDTNNVGSLTAIAKQ